MDDLRQYRFQPKKSCQPVDAVVISSPESSPPRQVEKKRSTFATKRGAIVIHDSDSEDDSAAPPKKQRIDDEGTSSPWFSTAVNGFHGSATKPAAKPKKSAKPSNTCSSPAASNFTGESSWSPSSSHTAPSQLSPSISQFSSPGTPGGCVKNLAHQSTPGTPSDARGSQLSQTSSAGTSGGSPRKHSSQSTLSSPGGSMMNNTSPPTPSNHLRYLGNQALQSIPGNPSKTLDNEGSQSSASQSSTSQSSAATKSYVSTASPVKKAENFDGLVQSLRSMFPQVSAAQARAVLEEEEGDHERTVTRLMCGDVSRRQAPPARRRVLQLPDSSDEDESEQPLGAAQVELEDESVDFLCEGFPAYDRQYIIDMLVASNGSVEQAFDLITAAGSSLKAQKAKRKENKTSSGSRMRDILDSEDDEDADFFKPQKLAKKRTGEAARIISDSSDSEIEEAESECKNKSPLMEFLNEAELPELLSVPGCNRNKAEMLIWLRPFESQEDLRAKLDEKKCQSLIGGVSEMMQMRKVVDSLMRKCETIGTRMQDIVQQLGYIDGETGAGGVITKQPDILTHGLQLKPYQLVGLNWLMLMHRQQLNGILADEMGLGKTIQTIAFLAQLLLDGDKGPHVVVVPSSTVDNWLRELSIWCPHLKVLLYYGSQDERADIREGIFENDMEEWHVMLTTYHMASGALHDRVLFKSHAFHYAIFDEGHMLKNMASIRYRHLMKINAERRLLLTGTPLQNNLVELMSLLAFVMPNFFTGKTDHLKTMFTQISTREESGGRYERATVDRAKSILKPFILRRLKVDVLKQLPKKDHHVIRVAMTPVQAEGYTDLKHSFVTKMAEVAENEVKRTTAGSAILMALRKAANHPLLDRKHYDREKLSKMAKLMLKEPTHRDANPDLILEDMEVMSDFELHRLCQNYPSVRQYILGDEILLESGKFQHLDSLLPGMAARGDRVLLFSQFTMMLDIIEVYMRIRKYKFIRLDGQTQVADRQGLIDRYNMQTDLFVFLLSTKAGGLGINLTAANTVILHDIDFNPYNDKQAEDRCHRVGQQRDVTVYRLISQHTIEEGMHACAERKLQLGADVTGLEGKKEKEKEAKDMVTLLQHALKDEH